MALGNNISIVAQTNYGNGTTPATGNWKPTTTPACVSATPEDKDCLSFRV
jgi:hypothetical protein